MAIRASVPHLKSGLKGHTCYQVSRCPVQPGNFITGHCNRCVGVSRESRNTSGGLPRKRRLVVFCASQHGPDNAGMFGRERHTSFVEATSCPHTLSPLALRSVRPAPHEASRQGEGHLPGHPYRGLLHAAAAEEAPGWARASACVGVVSVLDAEAVQIPPTDQTQAGKRTKNDTRMDHERFVDPFFNSLLEDKGDEALRAAHVVGVLTMRPAECLLLDAHAIGVEHCHPDCQQQHAQPIGKRESNANVI